MNPDKAARSRSRKFLVQALYQAQITGEEYALVVDPFIEEHNMKRADLDYFREVLKGIHGDLYNLLALVTAKLDRTYDELDFIERGILLLGCYELTARIEIPYKVVINEAVELAKTFGATDSYKYVNSVLDAVAQDVRSTEIK